MTLDYDVVIIGGSLAGRYAALTATQLKAKVALVEPKANGALTEDIAPYGLIYHQALNEVGNLVQHLGEAAQFGLHALCADTTEKCQISVDAPQAMLYARAVVSNLQEQHSPSLLAAKGVDMILGSGKFQSSPHVAFAVNERLLRARTYLLATSVRVLPEIEGLQKAGFLTLSEIWQSLSSPTPPKNWVIIGGVPQSIELAQTLVQLGCSVTLIVDRPYILSHVDPEIAHLLCSHLEAQGVRVLTETSVTQVRRIDDKKWLQAGDKAIEADEILVAIGQQPNIESLNLAAVGVKWNQRRLLVNDKLQTTNHRIYACGDVIGGYDCPNIANYEARIALQNALFCPRFKVNYLCIPWAIFTNPTLAQVGLTEAQAKRRYGDDEVIVLRQSFKTLVFAQLRDKITGICKLNILRNGEILGASVLGAEAAELINIIALAIAQKIKVNSLATLSPVYPSFTEILEQTATEWTQQRLSSNLAFQNFLESFFHERRNWNI
ncbi:MAG: NAD(P)/FAD-dependent oxidoreductase [Stigonema ocellatum SAG 48.90 = DSM 106950]|nr:NAD(P)/FAD-dependent oxidoreductase [Stigonema ocellatum SAG 48.90 = DSM 106950]